MARREVPADKLARLEQLPYTAAREPAKQRVLRALRPLRWTGDLPLTQKQQQHQHQQENEGMGNNAKLQLMDNEANNMEISKDLSAQTSEENKSGKGDLEEAEIEVSKDMEVEAKQPTEETVKQGNRERSRSPPVDDEARLRMSQASFNAARRLEGLPTRTATRQELNSNWHGSLASVEIDEELLAVEFNEKRLSWEEKGHGLSR